MYLLGSNVEFSTNKANAEEQNVCFKPFHRSSHYFSALLTNDMFYLIINRTFWYPNNSRTFIFWYLCTVEIGMRRGTNPFCHMIDGPQFLPYLYSDQETNLNRRQNTVPPTKTLCYYCCYYCYYILLLLLMCEDGG